MSHPNRLVVVGASLAGLRAVEAARKAGYEGSLTLIGAEPHLPYDRPPLSKYYLVDEPPADPTYKPREHYTDELEVDLVLGTPATSLDTAAKVVHVGDREIGYDALVLATGSSPRTLPNTPDLPGIRVLRTREDAEAIRDAFWDRARVVIIGAGFIGSEVAASAYQHSLYVTIVEALPTPLVRAVGEQMGARLARIHDDHGTDLRLGVGVDRFEGDGRVERVVLTDGTVLEADLVVVGVGASPNVAWLDGSGLRIEDGVVCDETLWTGADGVYAAGDIARWRNPMFDRVMRLEHWTSAAEQGALAARNALHPPNAKPYSTVPYFWSDQYDSKIQLVGIQATDEIRVVLGDLDGDWFVALYREGNRAVGALAFNKPAEIMKFRGLLMREPSWDAALAFAEQRKAAAGG